MSRWGVEIPIAGSICIEVEAESEDEALAEAWASYRANGTDDFDIYWDAIETITKAPCPEVSIEKIK